MFVLLRSGAFVFLVQRAIKAVQRIQGNVHPLLLQAALHLLLFLGELLPSFPFLPFHRSTAAPTLQIKNPSAPPRTAPQGVVSLCLQFERLLQTHLPQLFYHLRQIGAQP